MSMEYRRSFGEAIMMNFLAIEAQPQTNLYSPGGQYIKETFRSIWTNLGILGNMMTLTMFTLKHANSLLMVLFKMI